VDEGLVESRRGRGRFINAGARGLLMQGERQKFLAEEWPRVRATIQRLGLKAEELLTGSVDLRPTFRAPAGEVPGAKQPDERLSIAAEADDADSGEPEKEPKA
jgi:hypothetical protein